MARSLVALVVPPLLAVLVASGLLAPPPDAGAAPPGAVRLPGGAAYDAGRLALRVDGSGRLTVTDGRRTLLRDGRVSVTTLLGERRVTRLLSSRTTGGRLVALLGTDDPAGLRVRLTATRGVQQALTVRTEAVGGAVTATTVDWATSRTERFYGTGERADAVQRRGTTVRNYVEDGPYRREDQLLVAATVPLWGFGTRPDSTYFPVPWLLSTQGYGLLVRNDETSTFDLAAGAARRWTMEVESDEATWQVFAGPTPAEALRRFSAAVGRQPDVGAPWMFGPWVQTGQGDFVDPAEERGAIRALQEADAPVSVGETHMRYLPCGAHEGLEAEETARSAWFHRRGLAILTYVNPLLCTEYSEVFGPAAADGAVQKNALGAPFVYPAYVGGENFSVRPLSQFDFTSPHIDRHYGRIVDEMVAHGHDGWMEDFGEYTPPGAYDERGRTGSELHNAYVRDYHCGTQRMVGDVRRPLVRFVRSGWTGSARCSPVVWGGDPTSLWGFDGLRSVVTGGLSSGLSGIGVWGSDIGGFFALGAIRLTPELLARWIQLGSMSGIMRAKNDGVEVPDKTRPLVWDEPHRTTWRRWASLRTQLAPYLSDAAATYRRTGLPMMRHLVLSWPRSRAARQDTVFTLGRDLLVAPVLAPGARTRSLTLPPGRWVDLWRSASYVGRTGGLALRSSTRVLPGAQRVRLPAPLSEIPLLVRAGAVLVMLPDDVDTLAPFGRGGGVVRARERAGHRVVVAFPSGRTVTRFGRGERTVSTETPGGWSLRIEGRRARRYDVDASLATLSRPVGRVCRVSVDGRPLAPRRWQQRGDRVTFTVRARTATVRVAGC